MTYKSLKTKHMNWMSIIGLIFLFAGSLLSYFGGIKSDEQTKKTLSSEISSKNEKIDSLYKKLNIKMPRLIGSNNGMILYQFAY